MSLKRAAEILRGMAYVHRLHILVLLRDDEHTSAGLAAVIGADPTAIAHHLRSLLAVGLIRRERRGRNVFYALRGAETGQLVTEVLHYAERLT
jgi:DNA-binding transcriptional ArsR family regulator